MFEVGGSEVAMGIENQNDEMVVVVVYGQRKNGAGIQRLVLSAVLFRDKKHKQRHSAFSLFRDFKDRG